MMLLQVAFASPLAEALDLPSALDVDVRSAGVPPEVRTDVGVFSPQEGDSLLWLQTGHRSGPFEPGYDHPPGGPAGDRASVTVSLVVPPAHTLEIDFAFFTSEYPEYVGSWFNDRFRIDVTGAAWSGDAALDSRGKPVGVNSAFFEVVRPEALAGTGFEGNGGSTGWLTARVEVREATPLVVMFSVEDVSDGIYDSAVAIDNFRFSLDTTDGAGIHRAGQVPVSEPEPAPPRAAPPKPPRPPEPWTIWDVLPWLCVLWVLLVVAFVVYGYLRPARFPEDASIRIAGSERGLKRAASLVLVEHLGPFPAFWFDVALGLFADASLRSRLRASRVQLRADRDFGVVITGDFEVRDRRTRTFVRPEDADMGHVPDPQVVYRAGELWFKISR